MLEEEKKGLWSKERSESPMGSMMSKTGSGQKRTSVFQSSMIEREKKNLEKMMAKQVILLKSIHLTLNFHYIAKGNRTNHGL